MAEMMIKSPTDIFYENLPRYQEELDILLNPNIKRRGRKRKNKMYFTPITEKAIIAYNSEESYAKRNRLYKEHMHYAMWKLTQNIINRFKFPYMDGSTQDKQYECISFLLTKLNKFTCEKGRAFSYFSIVCKNYCIQSNNKAYAKLKTRRGLVAVDTNRNLSLESAETNRQEALKDFMDLFVERYENDVEGIFSKQHEQKIAYAILQIFRTRENIEKYNKKALYLLIREMTNERTQDISKVVNVIKKHFMEKYIAYDRGTI